MTDCPLPTTDIAEPPGLPAIGKWMIDPSGIPAHWIGEIYQGKHLREPINVLIVDELAGSVDDATQRLLTGCAAAGYPSREGHSSGYTGCIAGQRFSQWPATPNHAFSDGPYVLDNNHGRIFGPYADGNRFVFVGAFSREKVVPLAKIRHQYVSFDRARDDFTQRMAGSGRYRVTGDISLENAVVDAAFTTGDHDGIAVVITAVDQQPSQDR